MDLVVDLAANSWRYAVALFFFYAGVRAIVDWIKDIKFYSANAWDFSKPSGINYKQAMGDPSPVPYRARVILGAPILILTSMLSGLIVIFV